MSLLSSFRAPVDAGGRSWTRAERERTPHRGLMDRILGRRSEDADQSCALDGFGDQRARALAALARTEHQAVTARPRPWR
jgi:hypothetical protein